MRSQPRRELQLAGALALLGVLAAVGVVASRRGSNQRVVLAQDDQSLWLGEHAYINGLQVPLLDPALALTSTHLQASWVLCSSACTECSPKKLCCLGSPG